MTRWMRALAAGAALASAGVLSPAQVPLQRGGFTVTITNPPAGEFVLGEARITAQVEADDPQLVAKVEFYIDDALVFIDKEAPYELVHQFGEEPRSYVIRVEAYRNDGVITSDMRVTRRLVINYQTSVDRVVLAATATDKEGHPVLDLTGQDFTLTEDGVPQQIIDFYLEERPITMAVVVDTSGSMLQAMKGMQHAAGGFIEQLQEGDRALVIDFDEKVFLLQGLTDDKMELRRAIDSTYAQGGTAIYDALFSAFRLLSVAEGRKAIILMTDGDDYDSHFTLARILETARESEVVIYAIGLGSGINKGPLRDLTAETGGRAFFPGNVDELAETYLQVARELRSQYYLTYSSSNSASDGKWRKIKLESAREGVSIRTRRGYYGVKATGPVG